MITSNGHCVLIRIHSYHGSHPPIQRFDLESTMYNNNKNVYVGQQSDGGGGGVSWCSRVIVVVGDGVVHRYVNLCGSIGGCGGNI